MLLTHQFNSFKSGVIQQFFLRNDIFHCALLSFLEVPKMPKMR